MSRVQSLASKEFIDLTVRAELVHAAKFTLRKTSHHLYGIMILAYLSGLLAYYLQSGLLFQFTLGAYALFALPIIWLLGRTKEFIKNWLPLITLLLSYEALNGLAGAISNSGNLVSLYQFDRLLWGFNLTGTVQSSLYSSALTFLTGAIYSLHVPLVIIASVLFWYTDRGTYAKYATALIITSYLALLTFLVVPTAPPWYSDVAKDLIQDTRGPQVLFSDTLAKFSTLMESDKFAAFPSLHSAYITLFSLYTVHSRLYFGLISLPLLAAVLFSAIYLGQHYVIDLIGGAAYALGVAMLVNRVPKLRNALGF